MFIILLQRIVLFIVAYKMIPSKRHHQMILDIMRLMTNQFKEALNGHIQELIQY